MQHSSVAQEERLTVDSSKLKAEKRRAEKDNAETLSAQRQRGQEWSLAAALLKVFQNGKSWYTPGSFRKSAKERSYRIRNLEECAAHRKQTGLQNDFLHGKVRWEQKEFK